MATKKNIADFEKQLDELESIVENMEQGELSLNDSLKAFERGVKLTHSCLSALKDAELKISQLQSLDSDSPLIDFNNNE